MATLVACRLFLLLLAWLRLTGAARVVEFRAERAHAAPTLPEGGAWKYATTTELAKKQLARCIRPESPPDDLAWIEDLQRATVGGVPAKFSSKNCGTRRANGEWILSGTIHSGRPAYVRVGDENVKIHWSDKRQAWRLFIDNSLGVWRDTLYQSKSDEATMPMSGWEAVNAPLPAPSFTSDVADAAFYTWPQGQSRPLRSTVGGVSVGTMLPYHRAVVFSSNRSTEVPAGMDYPESHCYHFDYTASPGSVPDPHGCGLFRNSFSRLTSLRKCIVGKLEVSPRWQQYREVVKAIRAARQPGSIQAANPNVLREQDFDAVSDPKLLEVIEGCREDGKCVLYDANLRADEMIKYLSFKDWSTISKPLRAWVESKVRYTASVYQTMEDGSKNKNLGLEQNVVDGIVEECLGVTVDSYAELPAESQVLERSLVCNMIMWDSAEVPGAPEPPAVNAAAMWDTALGFTGAPIHELQRTPVACGRAAGILAGWPQIHAPKGYSATSCIMASEDMSWSSCAESSYFNCICFEKCWRTALRRVCDLTPNGGCCGDVL